METRARTGVTANRDMILHRIDPRSALAPFVELLWYYDIPPRPVEGRTKERVLPTGTFEFVFNLSEDRIRIYESHEIGRALSLSGAIACGVHSRYFCLDGERTGRVVGAHFKPGGAYPLFQNSAATFANRHVDLAEIFGPAITRLRRELMGFETPQSVFARVETFLLEHIDMNRAITPGVARLLDIWGTDPFREAVAAVQREHPISRKGFIAAFKRQVGLAPKKFSRVLRFQAVLKEIENADEVRWADIAHRCGYYDQSHFSRDFKSFSGLSPGQYRARVGSNPNHVTVG